MDTVIEVYGETGTGDLIAIGRGDITVQQFTLRELNDTTRIIRKADYVLKKKGEKNGVGATCTQVGKTTAEFSR